MHYIQNTINKLNTVNTNIGVPPKSYDILTTIKKINNNNLILKENEHFSNFLTIFEAYILENVNNDETAIFSAKRKLWAPVEKSIATIRENIT